MAQGHQTVGQKIVEYAKGRLGHQVGDGECFALADKALRRAGAKSAEDYSEIEDDGDYIWGTEVDIKDVGPGDILQFRNYNIATSVKTTTKSKGTEQWKTRESFAKRGHHTAIVEQNLHNGEIWILEQHVKPLGEKVQRHKILTTPATKITSHKQGTAEIVETTVTQIDGTVKAYRPASK